MTVTPPVHTLPPVRPLRTDPLTALLEALQHLASLDMSLFTSKDELRLTAYHDALCSLASTSKEGTEVYRCNTEQLPTGGSLSDATPDELRIATLAFHGLARDRLTPGTRSRDLGTWMGLAREALHLYKQPIAA